MSLNLKKLSFNGLALKTRHDIRSSISNITGMPFNIRVYGKFLNPLKCFLSIIHQQRTNFNDRLKISSSLVNHQCYANANARVWL